MKVYVVTGESGQYSDYSMWLVGVYATKEDANMVVALNDAAGVDPQYTYDASQFTATECEVITDVPSVSPPLEVGSVTKDGTVVAISSDRYPVVTYAELDQHGKNKRGYISRGECVYAPNGVAFDTTKLFPAE